MKMIKDASISDSQNQDGDFQSRPSRYEKLIFIIYLSILAALMIIAAWSGILLFAGEVEGGGPLGYLMEVLRIHLLL